MKLYQDEFESPIGMIYVVTDGQVVRAVDFDGSEQRKQRLLVRHYPGHVMHASKRINDATKRLKAYFSGDFQAINDIAAETNGTPFQQSVWAALRTIPTGKTVSYGAIAHLIGRPKACRAVGLANGSNPVAIIVPCHRVIGANATLTGFGGGLDRKRWLLAHEGIDRAW